MPWRLGSSSAFCLVMIFVIRTREARVAFIAPKSYNRLSIEKVPMAYRVHTFEAQVNGIDVTGQMFCPSEARIATFIFTKMGGSPIHESLVG